MHDAARRKLGWIIGQWCHAETVVCRPLWLNKFTLLMMKPAIRGEVLMADGPEMYRLYVECRNCKHEIALKKVWGPRPDRPPLTALAVQLTCPRCNFEAVYPPADIRLGDIDPDE